MDGNGIIEDKVDVLQVIGATPEYDKKGRATVWIIEVVDVDGTLKKLHISPEKMGANPERLIVAQRSVGGRVTIPRCPTATASAYYKGITHQRLETFFMEAVGTELPRQSIISSTFERFIHIYPVGEKVPLFWDSQLEFGLMLTNSYDLSLGIHVDGFLWEKETGTGLPLGLAGKWKSFYKHYHDHTKLFVQLKNRIGTILAKKQERIHQAQKWSETFIDENFYTAVGQALNFQKKELTPWISLTGETIGTVWEKNRGFVVKSMSEPRTAWLATRDFVRWASSLPDSRKIDVLQHIFAVVDKEVGKLPGGGSQ